MLLALSCQIILRTALDLITTHELRPAFIALGPACEEIWQSVVEEITVILNLSET